MSLILIFWTKNELYMSISQNTTFRSAFPYAVASFAIGTIGVVVSITAVATSIKIIGIVTTIIGSYVFIANLVFGFSYANSPKKFQKKFSKHLTSTIGSVIAEIISQIAIDTTAHLINKTLGIETNFMKVSII